MSKERRNEIKKNQKKKIIVPIISAVLVVVIAAVAIFALSFHKCDDCGTTFFGSGYYKEKDGQGVLGSVFGTFFGDTEGIPLEVVEDVIICEECAKNNVSVKAELRPVSEFKR